MPNANSKSSRTGIGHRDIAEGWDSTFYSLDPVLLHSPFDLPSPELTIRRIFSSTGRSARGSSKLPEENYARLASEWPLISTMDKEESERLWYSSVNIALHVWAVCGNLLFLRQDMEYEKSHHTSVLWRTYCSKLVDRFESHIFFSLTFIFITVISSLINIIGGESFIV